MIEEYQDAAIQDQEDIIQEDADIVHLVVTVKIYYIKLNNTIESTILKLYSTFLFYITMGKKIEEKYKELTEIEHVLLRPGMWVGSTKEEEQDLFIYNIKTGKMEQSTVSYVPAMLKLVDEVISNSCDEFRRKDNMGLDTISVYINQKKNLIEVSDNGGIPIVKHKDAGVYIPEFIFGRLRTSSNYDDTENRNVVGTNGVGAGLTNCFSTLYEVISADGKNKLSCSWHDNMQPSNNTKIEKCTKKEHYTKTFFTLDLKRFGVSELSDDFISIIHKRCIDAAAANPGLDVWFNTDSKVTNNVIQHYIFNSFDEYIDLYSDYLNTSDKILFNNDLCEAIVFPDSSVDIGFVNGAECSKGTHIRALRTAINSCVADYLTKKDKLKDLSPRSVESKYSVFMNINVSNPSYSSQTKEELTTPVENFSKDGKVFDISDKFLKKIEKSEIVNLVRDWYKKKVVAEDEKTLRKLNKEATKGLKRPDKYVPANSKHKFDRDLWIFEGDSAATGFRAGRDPETQGCYKMRGVPANCLDMTPVQIMKNEVFNDIVTVLGLQFGKDFSLTSMNYGHITIATDADVDGDKIAALLLLFFNNWPELFDKHIIRRVIAPIITVKNGKEKYQYYSLDKFKEDEKKLLRKNFIIKYIKGLGGLDQMSYKEMLQSNNFMYFEKDNNTESMFNRWFGKDSDERKQLMDV